MDRDKYHETFWTITDGSFGYSTFKVNYLRPWISLLHLRRQVKTLNKLVTYKLLQSHVLWIVERYGSNPSDGKSFPVKSKSYRTDQI